MKSTASRIHPGIILRTEFFEPMEITQLAAAKATGIPQSRLSEILAGRRSITPDTAARLGRYFRVDPRNWLNLQVAFDLWTLEQASGRQLDHDVKPLVAA
ncbi:MAG: HigA family addiction module antitoxin [Opitutaceae bacterium]|nr:HigA family addiction module antitoxin [Opitutaceae bacterium]